MKMFLFVIATLLFSDMSQAGQSGELVCVQWHFESNGESMTHVCDVDEMRVHITTDNDVGRPGAFAVGVQTADGQMAVWTVAGGFAAPQGGVETPADGYYQALPAFRDYIVYRGSPAGICALSSGRDFDLWAGHGALSAEKETELQALDQQAKRIKSAAALPLDHLRAAYIQIDGGGDSTHPAKGGVVYRHTCTTFHPSSN